MLHFVFELSQKPHNYARFTQTCDRARGSSWFSHFTCSNSLTLSMGATAVLEMAAAMPPAKKSFIKLVTASDMIGCFLWRSETSDFSKSGQDPQGNPTLLQVDQATPMCLNICGAIIARILSDGFTVGRTDKRGRINFRG